MFCLSGFIYRNLLLFNILVILLDVGFLIFLYLILFLGCIFNFLSMLCMVELFIESGMLYIVILRIGFFGLVRFVEYGLELYICMCWLFKLNFLIMSLFLFCFLFR